MCPSHLNQVSEECFRNLPPPLRKRLERILTDHRQAILHQRISVTHEQRGDGRPYWRLYLESGSNDQRHRRRVYIGPRGGPEMRNAIRELREACWGDPGTAKRFVKDLETQVVRHAREARKAVRKSQAAVLALIGQRLHGRTVRARRDIPAVERYQMEYRFLPMKALEKATWAGISEAQYVVLRRAARGTRGKGC